MIVSNLLCLLKNKKLPAFPIFWGGSSNHSLFDMPIKLLDNKYSSDIDYFMFINDLWKQNVLIKIWLTKHKLNLKVYQN